MKFNKNFILFFALLIIIFIVLVPSFRIEAASIPWPDIFLLAKDIGSESKINRPALILGILENESSFTTNLGSNTGSRSGNIQRCVNFCDSTICKTYGCDSCDSTPGRSKRKLWCTSHQNDLEKIVSEAEGLNKTSEEVLIASDYGMGPAQFQPGTWKLFPKLRGKNPWYINDAVHAIGYFLSDHNVNSDERGALKAYNPQKDYSDHVIKLAQEWETKFFTGVADIYDCKNISDYPCILQGLSDISKSCVSSGSVKQQKVCIQENIISRLKQKIQKIEQERSKHQPSPQPSPVIAPSIPDKFEITTTSLVPPTATVNVPYSSEPIIAAGGESPYKWSFYENSSPLGLSINKKGIIEGTPTQSGTYNFIIEAKDSSGGWLKGLFGAGQRTTKIFTLVVNEPDSSSQPSPPIGQVNIATANLAEAIVNTSYSAALAATGGKQPYKWSLYKNSSSLPPGLSINKKKGVIEGIPTTAGIYNFFVEVEDDSGSWFSSGLTATRALSLKVNEALKQPTPPQNCFDNTLSGQCSVNKPFFCENGELIQRASQCGCPQGQEKQTNDTCAAKPPVQTCSDGTAYNQCSTNKPKYCSNGYLDNRASICGCPVGQIAQGENCDVADIIEPKEDFSLSMRESITVTKGNTASQDISVIMPSWNTDTLSFEVRDVPPYVSHYFTSANCKASCTTFLEIDVGSPDTPAGTYQVTVGTHGGPNITKSFELKIVERISPSTPVLQATPISSSQIELNWSDNAAYDDSLMIERKIESNHDYVHVHGEQKRNLSSYVDSELNPNTRYCYRIYFTNPYVSSLNYSKEQCATTLQDISPIPQEEPDLTITSLRAPTTANVGNGTPMLSNVSITIANTGSVSAGRFRVEFYWSQDAIITVDDIPAASHFIPSGLGPGESKTGKELGRDIMVSIPESLSPGTYYLGAIIDDENEVKENNEANNSRAADTGPIILSGPPQPPIPTSPPDGFSYTYTIYNHKEPALGKQVFEWQKRNPNDTVKGQIFNGEQCEGSVIDTLVTDTPWNSGYIMKDRFSARKSYSWNLIGYSNGVPSAPSECRSFSVQAGTSP